MIIGDKPKKDESLTVFTEYDNEEKDEHIGKLYRVPRKKRGFRMSIPLSDLKHLSSQKQRWFRYDLEEVEEEDQEEVKSETQEQLEEVDKASRTPINLKLMSKGRKQKLKAIALGEMREQLEEDEEKENI